ncbi:MAG TPA: organomercurial lyase [Acidobacteriota bacterium]|nr:organomercurial lyase [Acidobacteriota bacterium]
MGEWKRDIIDQVRLFVYRTFAEEARAPSPLEMCDRFGMAPEELGRLLSHLEAEENAIVLLPDSPYLWMAEPFSALPTAFPVRSGGQNWFGNCIWDAFAILGLLHRDGEIETLSPIDNRPLRFRVREGRLEPVQAVIHFAVPARDWWKSIGFS